MIELITMGKKMLDIVKKGERTRLNEDEKLRIIPKNSIDDINLWSEWKSGRINFGMFTKDLFGRKIVDIDLAVEYSYNGKYNGRGCYVGNISVVPIKMKLPVFCSINIKCHHLDTLNIAKFTEDVHVLVKLRVEIYLKNIFQQVRRGNAIIKIYGDGEYTISWNFCHS